MHCYIRIDVHVYITHTIKPAQDIPFTGGTSIKNIFLINGLSVFSKKLVAVDQRLNVE